MTTEYIRHLFHELPFEKAVDAAIECIRAQLHDEINNGGARTGLILNDFTVGGEPVYGLKLHDTVPPHKFKASSVLLPTRASHTRYYFARIRQHEIITELAKRLSNGWYTTGTWGRDALDKINQCSRIINHYSAN